MSLNDEEEMGEDLRRYHESQGRVITAREALEEYYSENIERFSRLVTYRVAFDVLGKEVDDRLDSIQRQLYSLDGAFANEAAQILKGYPRWNFRFEQVFKDGSEVESMRIILAPTKMTEEERDREAAEINEKIQRTAGHYWKIVRISDAGLIPIEVLPMEE